MWVKFYAGNYARNQTSLAILVIFGQLHASLRKTEFILANRGILAMKNTLGVIILVLFITACTTTDEIIIDQKGVNMSAYQQDLEQCQAYAKQVKTSEKTTKGAASGALVGGLIGAITGGSSGAVTGAGVGAVGGGAKGANQGQQSEVQVVRRCLSGRGYRVLN